MPAALRVLYVDDEPDLLNIGKLFLERSGDFTVTTAMSGPEAIRLLEQEQFDAIISDYQMADMDGIQFLVEVRTRFGPIPFILFTGRGREEVVIQAINRGADFYIRKGGNPQAQFVELANLIRQVTSLKRAEKALKESEEKYRQLVELAKEGIWAIDAGYNTTYLNPRMAEMLQYTVDEMQGLPLVSFMDDAGKKFFEEKTDHRRQGIAEEHPFEFITKGGNRIYVTISMSPLTDDKGVYQGAIAVISDITGRKWVEEALREDNKKLNLLFDISRQDINRQLSVLTENLRIFQRKQPDIAHDEYLQKISGAVRTISGLVRFTSEYEKIGFNASVWLECRAVVDNAAKQAPLGKVMVNNDIPAGVEIFADPLVARVFINLMENAARYGDTITTIMFTAGESGEDYRIVCEDDGVGVPPFAKEKIFDRGFGKNTGMGLFLSREILSIIGITIKETGETGKGARFEILVPKRMWRMAGLK